MNETSYGAGMTPTASQQLAESVVADGVGAHRAAIVALVADARRLGVNPVLADIVTDPSGPDVARERALGRLVVEHACLSERHDSRLPARSVAPAA